MTSHPDSHPDDQKDLDLVAVLVTGNASALTIAESILRGEGIPFLVKGKGIQDLFGFGQINIFNPITGSVRVQVRAEDQEAAREALGELLANEE